MAEGVAENVNDVAATTACLFLSINSSESKS
jgi:hypothetical protein